MIMFVTGTRPSSIKVQPLVDCCERMSIDYEVWNTNQHQTDMQVFDMTGDTVSTVTSEKRPIRFANMIHDFIMHCDIHKKPRIVVVVGDTDSALAAATAANMYGIPVAHVEAGVRSFYNMPEEINRIAIDQMATYLFAPTTEALANLAVDKLTGIHVGNIMVESLLRYGDIKKKEGLKYILVEIHRAENDDNIIDICTLCGALSLPVKWVKHPRYEGKGIYQKLPNIEYLTPQSYKAMTALVSNASLVITDSGGLQVDSCYLNVPCITIRKSTEWGETISSGANILVDPVYNISNIHQIYEEHMNTKFSTDFLIELWDDQVSERIMEILL